MSPSSRLGRACFYFTNERDQLITAAIFHFARFSLAYQLLIGQAETNQLPKSNGTSFSLCLPERKRESLSREQWSICCRFSRKYPLCLGYCLSLLRSDQWKVISIGYESRERSRLGTIKAQKRNHCQIDDRHIHQVQVESFSMSSMPQETKERERMWHSSTKFS